MIRVVELTKCFKNICVLNEVSFEVKQGEIFGIIGPNGAGKTTLLKILSTLILPTKGTAHINGYDIVKEQIKVKVSIGLVTGDERSFYWRLTGRKNLEFFATFYNIPKKLAKERIDYLTDLIKIENIDKRVAEYSSGMKQRLGIARSLLHNPPVLLMDEPTKSLDPGNAYDLRLFMKEDLSKKEGKTIIIATHNLNEAKQICDNVCLLNQGKMFNLPRDGDLEEIYNKFVI